MGLCSLLIQMVDRRQLGIVPNIFSQRVINFQIPLVTIISLSLYIYIIVDDYYLADIKFIINFIYLFLYEILYWLIYVEVRIMDMTDVTISSILGCRMHFSFIARDVLETCNSIMMSFSFLVGRG